MEINDIYNYFSNKEKIECACNKYIKNKLKVNSFLITDIYNMGGGILGINYLYNGLANTEKVIIKNIIEYL